MKKSSKIIFGCVLLLIFIAGFVVLIKVYNNPEKTPEVFETPEISQTLETKPKTEATTELETTTEKLTEVVELTEATEPPQATELIIAAAVVEDLISKNVPILMYHTSSEKEPGGSLRGLYVKPSEFEKQVQYLSENGFTFCTFDDYYNLNNINKPVFITFDDGYKENYTEIFPILKEYNVKITLFLTLFHITESNITRDMIVEMSDSGFVKFESHTLNHPDLTVSNEANLLKELENSKIQIEEITGKTVLALAYPAGAFNETVKEKTKEFYFFGLRKDLGMHNTEYDPYEVRRIRIDRDTLFETFKKLVG